MNNGLTHFDNEGKVIMVDVSDKDETQRIAIARGKIIMNKATLECIENGSIGKGDVLGVARVAGIMASKNTSGLIPMCHPIMITGCSVDFIIDRENNGINIETKVKTTGKTGVEMEALTATSIAALTIYDMCKAIDKTMTITGIHLVEKMGGKSGHFKLHE